MVQKMAVISFSDMHTIIAARQSIQDFGLPLLQARKQNSYSF